MRLGYASSDLRRSAEFDIDRATVALRVATVVWCVGVLWNGYSDLESFDWGPMALRYHMKYWPRPLSAAATLALLPVAVLLTAITVLMRGSISQVGKVVLAGVWLALSTVRATALGVLYWGTSESLSWWTGVAATLVAVWHVASLSVVPLTLLVVSTSRLREIAVDRLLWRMTVLPLAAACTVGILRWSFLPISTIGWIKLGVGITHGWSLALNTFMMVALAGCSTLLISRGRTGRSINVVNVVAVSLVVMTILCNVFLHVLENPLPDRRELIALMTSTLREALTYGSSLLPLLALWLPRRRRLA